MPMKFILFVTLVPTAIILAPVILFGGLWEINPVLSILAMVAVAGGAGLWIKNKIKPKVRYK